MLWMSIVPVLTGALAAAIPVFRSWPALNPTWARFEAARDKRDDQRNFSTFARLHVRRNLADVFNQRHGNKWCGLVAMGRSQCGRGLS